MSAKGDSEASNACLTALLIVVKQHDEGNQSTLGFLSTKEVGRLSICSTGTMAAVNGSFVWKRLFEQAVKVSEKYDLPDVADLQDYIVQRGEEEGILPCFAIPDPKVIARIGGYKRAAGCLFSRSCFYCGKLACYGVPLTMTRVCRDCFGTNESCWMIKESDAKNRYLLADDDFASLASATISGEMTFSMKEVEAVACTKWGNADGLKSELVRRASECDSEVKVPFLGFQTIGACLLGAICRIDKQILHEKEGRIIERYIVKDSLTRLEATRPVKCTHCQLMGSMDDILLHERSVHGNIVLPEGLPTRRATLEICAPPPLDELCTAAVPQELIDKVNGANLQYSSSDGRVIEGHTWIHAIHCFMTFGNGVKVSAFWCKVVWETNSDHGIWGALSIAYQVGENNLPVHLIYDTLAPQPTFGVTSEICRGRKREGSEEQFDVLKAALGLKSTSSSQLVAMIISKVVIIPDFLSSFNYIDHTGYCTTWRPELGGLQIYKSAIELLSARKWKVWIRPSSDSTVAFDPFVFRVTYTTSLGDVTRLLSERLGVKANKLAFWDRDASEGRIRLRNAGCMGHLSYYNAHEVFVGIMPDSHSFKVSVHPHSSSTLDFAPLFFLVKFSTRFSLIADIMSARLGVPLEGMSFRGKYEVKLDSVDCRCGDVPIDGQGIIYLQVSW